MAANAASSAPALEDLADQLGALVGTLARLAGGYRRSYPGWDDWCGSTLHRTMDIAYAIERALALGCRLDPRISDRLAIKLDYSLHYASRLHGSGELSRHGARGLIRALRTTGNCLRRRQGRAVQDAILEREALVLDCLAWLLPAPQRGRFIDEQLGNLAYCGGWWQRVDHLVCLAIGTPRLAWMMRREGRRGGCDRRRSSLDAGQPG